MRRTIGQALLVPLAMALFAAVVPERALAEDETSETRFLRAAATGEAGIVGALLSAGHQPDGRDAEGRTALHLAAQGGHRVTAEALLRGGADINATDTHGDTPLDFAIRGGHTGLEGFLRDKGAKPGTTKAVETVPTRTADPAASAAAHAMAERLRLVLPAGWSCDITTEPGEMGHAHGLGEPAFRLDFKNPTRRFPAEHGAISKGTLESNLRLNFHPISEREQVERVVRKESVYSHDIPVVFGMTDDYIIVTSPGWRNWGYSTRKANEAIHPLMQVLSTELVVTGHFPWAKAEMTRQVEIILKDVAALGKGATRADVLESFMEEGGLSTAERRTYVHRVCPYVKIDVDFEASDKGREQTTDRVVSVSRPYLAWSIMD